MNLEVDMDLLIELVQQYPHLYDIRDKNYKNNECKEKCWETIAIQIEVSVDDCKRLWRNLRDRFNKEKRLHFSDTETSESSWPYFSKMMFYAKYSMPRKTVVTTSRLNLERPGSSTSTADGHLWGGLDLMSPELVSRPKEEDEFVTTPPETSQNTYDTTRTWPCGESESSPKKIKQERVQQEFEEMTTPVFRNVPLHPKDDVNETFGAYVVSRLKEMNPVVAKQKRKKMLLLLEDDD